MFNNSYFWPKAIVHIDGDSFFASCLQSIDPSLRGKPLVVGRDRGIATAVSPEAKKLGIIRGMPIYQIKRLVPSCIIASSDYELYEMMSHKMFEIMRKYTPFVEPYSIDEAFADITGLRRMHHASYEQIVKRMKQEIQESLDISVSVGLSVNKSLAKLSSNHKKPNGLCVFSGREIHLLLSTTLIEQIWGIGPNTSALLRKYQIKTALDFANQAEKFVTTILSKPGIEIWRELNGEYLFKINPNSKDTYKSISKIHTFQPSYDSDFIYGQLINNLDGVCKKARKFKLVSKKIFIGLKGQDFKMYGVEMRLPYETYYQAEMITFIKEAFLHLFIKGKLYRATTVVLSDLQSFTNTQYQLFDDPKKSEKVKLLFDSIDVLSAKYGNNTVKTASTLFIHQDKDGRTLSLPIVSLKI